jgi:hypothetical protein
MVSTAVTVVLVGFLLIGFPFALVGAVFVSRGVDRARERQELRAAAMDTVASVQAGQRAKLLGTAKAADTTPPLEAGFSGELALAVQYVVVEARPDGDGGTDERRVYEGARTVPCELTDETGSVPVDADPETVDASDEHHESIRVGKGEEPPERVQQFLRATADVDGVFEGVDVGPFNFGGRTRYYREWRIAPGDRVFVYGTGDRDPGADWGESLVVRTNEADDGLFTNYSLEEYANESLLGIVWYLVVGTALLVAPVAVLTYMLLEMGAL